MARKATTKASSTSRSKGSKKGASKPLTTAVAKRPQGRSRSGAAPDMGEAFVRLLQSPLVAELVAVAATSALAALAEHGFTSRGGSDEARGKRAGKAVKEAGKAAAAAVGRRLSTELDEIRKASATKGGAKA
jgi:hypothetical protein